jgi:hypothetical protein
MVLLPVRRRSARPICVLYLASAALLIIVMLPALRKKREAVFVADTNSPDRPHHGVALVCTSTWNCSWNG